MICCSSMGQDRDGLTNENAPQKVWSCKGEKLSERILCTLSESGRC